MTRAIQQQMKITTFFSSFDTAPFPYRYLGEERASVIPIPQEFYTRKSIQDYVALHD